MTSPIVFFDIETGGLKPDSPIIEAAAVVVDFDFADAPGFIEEHEWHIAFVQSSCEPKALEVNRFHDRADKWKDAISVPAFLSRFASILERHRSIPKQGRNRPYWVARVGGHNIRSFDVPRVAALFSAYNMFFPVGYNEALDTLTMASEYFFRHRHAEAPPEKFNLDALCRHFEIPEYGDAHSALADARRAVQLAWRLLR